MRRKAEVRWWFKKPKRLIASLIRFELDHYFFQCRRRHFGYNARCTVGASLGRGSCKEKSDA